VNAGAETRALVDRTRKAQGLPPRVEDPAILAKVAALVGPVRTKNGNGIHPVPERESTPVAQAGVDQDCLFTTNVTSTARKGDARGPR